MAALLDPPLGADDHVTGAPAADLELVMYGDFQCPYCTAAQGPLRRVTERLGERLRFAYRHFPIPELHPDAERAAQAAEAAAAQGAFWAMHDALYRSGGNLREGDILAIARELGLDAARMHQELRDGRHAARVARDVQSGRRSGVARTPTFFADGALVDGAFDAGSLVAALTR